ncbi:MAG: hypothetical protein WAV04_02125 [Candidatus Microsaccharimonas sp.]
MIWILILGIIVLGFGFVIFFGAPYVPSQRKFVRRAFENLYKVTAKDVLVDVGSGDGVVLRVAAEMGARAVGYEIHPFFVLLSRFLSRGNTNVTVKLANFWQVSLPNDTTIVYIFSVNRDGKKIMRKMQQEADRLQKKLSLMCHGNPLPGMKSEKSFEAYHLYTFHPLQSSQAQV